MNFGKSGAYENIVEKIKTGIYAKSRNTLKVNRNILIKTKEKLTRKLMKGNSKQEKGDKAKIEKIDKIMKAMNTIEAEPGNAVVNAPVVAPVAPVAPVIHEPAVARASPNKHTQDLVKALQADFFKTMGALSKVELEAVMKHLSGVYYNDGLSLISDENYDRLSELLKTKFGEVLGVGAEVTKQKVKLPYFMGSMDKIKPEKQNLASWLLKYKGDVCISDKLDGISALYMKSGNKRTLYTRGDGTVGQDISHMIPYIQLGDFPDLEHCAVRGELIVSKANYDKVKEGKRGARQMVSGLANQKTLTKERLELMRLVELVAYEVIVPEGLTASEQFKRLDAHSTFHTARWELRKDISIESLSELLTKRKDTSKYEIDGIIVAHDAVYPRVVGNPDHAFAFKMSFADQQTTTEVLQVNWEPSKHGQLKPVVNFEPVNIGGVIIQYATGFNASFIHDNGIGPGAFVDIIRSGDVIPYIKAVRSPAPGGPQMPPFKWHWNETHVDAVLDDIGGNPDVDKRILLFFAQTLDIGFCGEGNIAKLYTAGVHTIPQFVAIKEADLVKSGEFTAKTAAKLVGEIQKGVAKANVLDWAVACGLFGRGMGHRRLEPALAFLPASLEAPGDLVSKVAGLSGWSRESAEGFVETLPKFKAFLDTVGVKPKAPTPVKAVVGGKLVGQTVLFTGFHPKDLEAFVKSEGGILAESWGSKVTLLVIKEEGVVNEKTKKAAAGGIPILTATAFKGRYM